MEYNIEASTEDLEDLHQYLYENHPDIKVDEIYKNTQGYLKEPVVVALIATVAASPVLIAAVKAYFKYKTSIDNVLQQEITKRFKIAIQADGKSTLINFEGPALSTDDQKPAKPPKHTATLITAGNATKKLSAISKKRKKE